MVVEIVFSELKSTFKRLITSLNNIFLEKI